MILYFYQTTCLSLYGHLRSNGEENNIFLSSDQFSQNLMLLRGGIIMIILYSKISSRSKTHLWVETRVEKSLEHELVFISLMNCENIGGQT